LKIAVIQFPGSNCDQDALWSLRSDLGVEAEYVWHSERSLDGFDGAFIPGGFTYGDYLRCGSIAGQSQVMQAVREMADSGRPVLGACNGFQILCETGILPGALVQNIDQRFVCTTIHLRTENRDSAWTTKCPDVLPIPVAHGEGRFVADEETLRELNGDGRVAFRYCDETGVLTEAANFNGSVESIAGVLNKRGNVLGMMPHPERVTNKKIGSEAGLPIISGFLSVLANA
jgi:phosphoribosylformylglycinamidine synthase subunit PurQ / glutaminase